MTSTSTGQRPTGQRRADTGPRIGPRRERVPAGPRALARVAQRRTRRRATARRVLLSWPLGRAVVLLIALLGAAVLIYPHAQAWFNDRSQAGVVSGYAEQQQARTPEQTRAQLDAARAYNASLPSGPVGDPFATDAGTTRSAELARYDDTLNLGPNGLMGALTIPSIGVNLPVYHGTSNTVLDAGIGHLYGTALPVGGPGTHAVLTGHSGVLGDTLLTDLDKLHDGDTFTITVLDQALTYQIDQILTVLPSQTGALAAVPGQDYVTLVTCTPIGVNSHRLLIRGHRVPTPASGESAVQALLDHTGPGFPWWIVIAALVLVAGVAATTPLARRLPAEVVA
ncbi:MAG: class C sortase [Actinomycetia bacterium]|nr:class C sortase [Actinomycetes bacterium]